MLKYTIEWALQSENWIEKCEEHNQPGIKGWLNDWWIKGELQIIFVNKVEVSLCFSAQSPVWTPKKKRVHSWIWKHSVIYVISKFSQTVVEKSKVPYVLNCEGITAPWEPAQICAAAQSLSTGGCTLSVGLPNTDSESEFQLLFCE